MRRNSGSMSPASSLGSSSSPPRCPSTKRARHTSFDGDSIASYESRDNRMVSLALQESLAKSPTRRAATPSPLRDRSRSSSRSSTASAREQQLEQQIQDQQEQIKQQQQEIDLLRQQLKQIMQQLKQPTTQTTPSTTTTAATTQPIESTSMQD